MNIVDILFEDPIDSSYVFIKHEWKYIKVKQDVKFGETYPISYAPNIEIYNIISNSNLHIYTKSNHEYFNMYIIHKNINNNFLKVDTFMNCLITNNTENSITIGCNVNITYKDINIHEDLDILGDTIYAIRKHKRLENIKYFLK